MSQFYIVNESTEDTLETTDNLDDAVRMASQAASDGQAGDPVSILESGGKSIRQFVLMPDGTVREQPVSRQAKPLDTTQP